MSGKFFSKENLLSEKAIVVYFVLLKLAICLFPFEYGLFRDELYYIALSDNLDFGYVDVPPLAPFLLAMVRLIMGTSFFSLHLLPAVCGALVVLLVYSMVKKMGGNFGALLLSLTCVTLAPIYICWESLFTYDAFDKLCWTLALYAMVLLLKTGEKKYWIFFGIAAGIGLLVKITMLYLGFGILTALLLTKERRYFSSRQLWMGGAIALLIFSPYILWQIKEGFPALEYYKNYALGKTWPVTPLEFIKNQIVVMNILSFPVWLAGLYYFIFNKEGKKFKVLGYAYIIILIIGIILKVKFYLIAPFYTVLFAGGAVFIEGFAERRKIGWLKRKAAIVILLGGLAHVPFVRPILPIDVFIKYTGDDAYMGVKGERVKLQELHQHFADRFGWEEMAARVGDVYNSLSEEEKVKACVLTGNYGEAGAVWFFGEKYNLPKPISGHLQYFIWGPRGNSGEVVISLGIDTKKLKNHFDNVEQIGEKKC
ncbi:MAG: glycosyltransferase family 39 protein, partial [Planctomycetota bacterium]